MNGSFLSVPYHAFRVDLLSPLFFSSPPPKFCSEKAVYWFSSKPISAAWRVVCQTLMCERSLEPNDAPNLHGSATSGAHEDAGSGGDNRSRSL